MDYEKSKRNKLTGAVIVAAGMSTRMNVFKPMLSFGTSTIIRTLIGTFIRAEVNPIVLVTGYKSQELMDHVNDLDILGTKNSNYATSDMFVSACLGLNMIKEYSKYVFFIPGDMPLISLDSLNQMYSYMTTHQADILIPINNNRKGHPVLIRNQIIENLTSYKGEGGLNLAIKNCQGKKEYITLYDPGIILGANDLEEYKRLIDYSTNGN